MSETTRIEFMVLGAPPSDTIPRGLPAKKMVADYLPHELADMKALKAKVQGMPEGPERTALLDEIMVIHSLKALLGATILTDDEIAAVGLEPLPVVEVETVVAEPVERGEQAAFFTTSELPALNEARKAWERKRGKAHVERDPYEASTALDRPDHGLQARASDPSNSHAAGRSAEEREGSTATFTQGSHKHRILRIYAASDEPLTDTQAWMGAGIHYRSGAWHRCSDLLDVGAIRMVDSVVDSETGAMVRRCVVTEVGLTVLSRLDKGEKQVKV